MKQSGSLIATFGIVLFFSVTCSCQKSSTSWVKIYGTKSWAQILCVQESPNGGFVGVGKRGCDVFLLKFDSNGDTLWSRVYGGSSDEQGYFVVPTNDGGYVITGYKWLIGKGRSLYIIKVNTDGETAWTKSYGSENGFSSGKFIHQKAGTEKWGRCPSI